MEHQGSSSAVNCQGEVPSPEITGSRAKSVSAKQICVMMWCCAQATEQQSKPPVPHLQIAVRSEEPYRLQAYTVLRGLAGTDARANPDAAGQPLCGGSHADAAPAQNCSVIASPSDIASLSCPACFVTGACCLARSTTFDVLPSFSSGMLLSSSS